MVGGDFNIIRSFHEKKGGIRRLEQISKVFNDYIKNLHLADLPCNNDIYTWNNHRGGKSQIVCHLDRFLISKETVQRDIYVEASIFPCMGSDHWPIQLEIDLKEASSNLPFHFERF